MRISHRELKAWSRQHGLRVYLGRPSGALRDEFLRAVEQSRELHEPWVFPPEDEEEYDSWMKRARRKGMDGLFVHHAESDALVGAIEIGQIFYGPLRSAYTGYYAFTEYAGQGLMTEGLAMAVRYAFEKLQLHRLEANIQPGNAFSLKLVKRVGFEKEGFSKDYLYIDGAWRDHERWAIRSDMPVAG